MENLKVTTIQTHLHWENAEHGVGMEKRDYLPEMFSTGFSMDARALAEPMNLHTFKWMKNMAAKTGALLIGSLIIQENEKYFNRLIWMEPDGNFRMYDKRHLFRMGQEEKTYAPGDRRLVAEWKGWKICPLVCYDLRFPAWSRNQFNKQSKDSQYDLLVYVANWPAARSHHWQTLLRARAIENLSYVIGVNRVGLDGKQVSYEGRTLVIDPKGEPIHDAGTQETIQTTELSAEVLHAWRTKFPAYLDADDFEMKG